MIRALTAFPLAKWCACALILLAPGSFILLPVMWLARSWSAARTAR